MPEIKNLGPFDAAHSIDSYKKAHDNRQLYVAVVSDDSRPRVFIEVNNDYIGVGFLDTFLREYLSYQFQIVEVGRLFLTMATHREFDGDSDRVTSGTTFYFKQNGDVTFVSEDFLSNSHNTQDTHCDVKGNWEPYPTFGNYESIVRENREQ